ncbi:MAG: CbtB-domain containing protein [Chroococcus sp. CMT-3BRIN-NPC107]|jgi:hypothetical protein|nr:CbtB-domain containing protein [Chroococcus sp. CMT-3BRIN-NPC107]
MPANVRITYINVRGTLVVRATNNLSFVQNRAIDWTLSLPVQLTLYTSLCALTLWTVYFSTYPAAHDSMHSLRHHTLTISCH